MLVISSGNSAYVDVSCQPNYLWSPCPVEWQKLHRHFFKNKSCRWDVTTNAYASHRSRCFSQGMLIALWSQSFICDPIPIDITGWHTSDMLPKEAAANRQALYPVSRGSAKANIYLILSFVMRDNLRTQHPKGRSPSMLTFGSLRYAGWFASLHYPPSCKS